MLLVGESRHVSDHIQHGIAKVNSKNCARQQNESNGKSTAAGVQPFTLLCIYIFRCCCSIMGLKPNQSWGFQLMLDEFGGFKCSSLSILLGCRNCQGRAGRGGTDPSEDCGRPSRLEMVPGMGQALTGKMLILDDKSYTWGQMLQGCAYTCIIVYILLLELCICRYVWCVMMFFSAIWFLLHPFYSFPQYTPRFNKHWVWKMMFLLILQ